MSFFNIMSLQLKGPLTLNSQGKSVLIGKGQPGPPPTQICFRSGSGKRAPFCTNPRRFRASCEFCDDSMILHLKKMSRMAKNRKSARDFKAKKARKARALRNEFQRNRARFLKAANILKEIVRINSKLADDIRIAQNNLTFLEIEEIIRNWDQHSELSPDSLLNPNQTHSVPIWYITWLRGPQIQIKSTEAPVLRISKLPDPETQIFIITREHLLERKVNCYAFC